MKVKPPVLTDTELRNIIPKGFHYLLDYKEELNLVLEAQRDADVEWCVQAKAEVAREIFEEIGKSASHLQEPVEVAFYFYKKDWQSLKDKWLKKAKK